MFTILKIQEKCTFILKERGGRDGERQRQRDRDKDREIETERHRQTDRQKCLYKERTQNVLL